MTRARAMDSASVRRKLVKPIKDKNADVVGCACKA